MLFVVAFVTWRNAIFTNTYISKLLYGKTLAAWEKICLSCNNCKYDRCSINDLNVRSKMLCMGSFYSNLHIKAH
ncbi:MAG TPA: hypothetical protein VIO64_15350 [Pseudobacteroides sp.]|uniref:hypothetical protein n=1 Tax=Pseudobacteroides sp. TaxID=1968840 RepID=UPI002F95FAF3